MSRERLPFVDTHIHFHDMTRPELRYEWLEPDEPIDPVVGPDGAIKSQRYWADDFLAETRFQNVVGTVHVQAAIGTADPVDETRWLEEFRRRVGVPHGIIGAVDLTRPDADEVLDRHRSASDAFRGVRDLRYDDYLHDPAWLRGVAALERRELVLCDDPWLEEFGVARHMAESHPGLTFCLDHAGYPEHVGRPRRRTPEAYDAWRAGVRELARAENAVVKISGLGMSDHPWTVGTIRRWVLDCIEAFGVERSFFGTNWPVDRLYSSYGDVLDAFETIIAEFTPRERTALFSGNAIRVFDLRDVDSAAQAQTGTASGSGTASASSPSELTSTT